MANDYYTPTGWPETSGDGDSIDARNEMAAIEDAFDKCPTLSGNGSAAVFVNAGGTALAATAASAARTLIGMAIGSDAQAYSDELQAISDLSPTTAQPINFTSASAAELLTFYDQDAMSGDDEDGLASQQSIKAYIDTKVASLGAIMRGPTGAKMVFYNASAPTGWTIESGYDGRVCACHETTDGAFGSDRLDQTITTNTVSSNHQHTWSYAPNSGGSNQGQSFQIAIYPPSYNVLALSHYHNFSMSGISDFISANHSHNFSAINGIYCVFAERD